MASGLAMGHVFMFPLSTGNLSGIHSADSVDGATVSVTSWVSPAVSRTCFLGALCKARESGVSPPSPLAPIIFLPSLLQSSLTPDGRDLVTTSQLVLSVPRSPTLFELSNVYLCINPIRYNRKCLWWWLSKLQVCKYRRLSLVVILLLYSFSRMKVFSFSLGQWPI